jgi:hypothetical protein
MTALSGTVAAALPGMQGFDCDSVLDAVAADRLYGSGFRFAIRYLSRTAPQNPGDLSAAEAALILAAGLALTAVQHCPLPGWSPSAAVGQAYGQAAAQNAAAIGLPVGLSLWLDLEGAASWATAAATIAHVNGWAGAVEAAGYLPGLYVGANQPLSGDELYWRLRVTRYWQSASDVPAIPYRGYCLAQALAPSPIDGVDLDRDVAMNDLFGGAAMMLIPAPAAAPMWSSSGAVVNIPTPLWIGPRQPTTATSGLAG